MRDGKGGGVGESKEPQGERSESAGARGTAVRSPCQLYAVAITRRRAD